MRAFEDGLWAHLVDEHQADHVILSSRPRRRRARPLAMVTGAGGLAAVALATMLVFGATTSTPPAYALTRNSNGSVTVTIRDLTRAIPALNARFARMGIDETVIPVRAHCGTSNWTVDALGPNQVPQSVMHESLTFYPGRKYLAPGYDGFLAAARLPNGKIALSIGALKPPLPSCFSKIVQGTIRK